MTYYFKCGNFKIEGVVFMYTDDILMTGEIYVKNGPEPFQMDAEDEDLISDLEVKSATEGILPFESQVLDMFKVLESKKGTEDYSGCDEFWVSFVDGEQITMIEQQAIPIIAPMTRTFKSKADLEKSFTRLTEFLDKARYVGRYFRRTDSLESNGDRSFSNKDGRVLVLYATDDLMIIRHSFIEEEFGILDRRYLKDGKYEFYGQPTDKYRDKPSLYRAINEQIAQKSKGRHL